MRVQKNVELILLFAILFFFILFLNDISGTSNVSKKNITNIGNEKIDKSIKFDNVFNKFKIYNDNIDSSTVKIFIDVIDKFELDTNNTLLGIYISQICLESGAKQYYPNGKLVISYASAIGITQIVPTTAFYYLRNVAGRDNKILTDLGISDYNYVFDYGRYQPNEKALNQTKEWVSNINNNIILWGLIMRCNLDRNNDNVYKSLIEYNAGSNGLKKHLNKGYNVKQHNYVKLILVINEKLNIKGDC